MDDAALIAQALAALAAVKLAQKRPPAQIGAVVAVLRDNGMDALATALVGSLPFGDGPQYEGLMQ